MIRRATAADASDLAALHKASILQLCAGEYTLEQRTEWVAALAPPLYVALISTREMFVFERASELLGLCVFDLESGFIHASYVHPSAVRSGIGRQLMATAERALLEHGAREVQLNATLNAVPFYEALGYVRLGSASNRLPSGVELPCMMMHKALG